MIDTPARPSAARAILVTWLVTAAWDFVCATMLSVFAYGSTFSRLWQGVAATVLGPAATTMGARGVAVGLGLHLLVALAWSTIFVLAVAASVALRRFITRPGNAVAVAIVYGPLIWLVMSLLVIPAATGRPPAFGFRWWVQVFAHVPFVTLPLVFTARRALGLARGESTATRGRMEMYLILPLVLPGVLSLLTPQAPAAPPLSQLLGTWRGTSVCTDRVAAPACQDETVVYEFTRGTKPGTVHWLADKIVNDKRESMGEMDLSYDSAESCWKAEFSSPRLKSVWRLTVDNDRLTGTARLVPGEATVRRVALRKQ